VISVRKGAQANWRPCPLRDRPGPQLTSPSDHRISLDVTACHSLARTSCWLGPVGRVAVSPRSP